VSDFIAQFVDAMRSAGCGPAPGVSIVANDKWTDYQIESDPARKKKGAYSLKIVDTDFAIGCFTDRRDGQIRKWHSNATREYSPEEKKQWKMRIEAAQKESEEKRRAEQVAVSEQAKLVWDRARTAAPDHLYLLRKNVDAEFLRLDGDDLLVPMYAEGVMWGFQRITPDGDKYFLTGARKQGTYLALCHIDEDKSKVFLCEGLATGKTIRRVTGLPVLICWDAGNLKHVALAMKEKYPTAQFIIAADNDQYTVKPDGTPYNSGIEAAQQAAASIGGAHVIWPEFPADHPEKPTDFNDMAKLHGDDAVRGRLFEVKVPDKPKPKQEVEYWESLMLEKSRDKHDNPTFKDISSNYSVLVRHHPVFNGLFAYNEFHQEIWMVKCPVWIKEDEFKVHSVDEADEREVDYQIQRFNFGFTGSIDKTRGAIADAALCNRIHPARDYFNGLVWDGTPRLDDWLLRYCGAIKDDPAYVRAVGRTWMTAAVKRVFHPGCKFDHMLILEGSQGAGKSTTLRELATFGAGEGERDYFLDTLNLKNLDNKDELMKMAGKLIVEIQEMASFTKTDYDVMKGFITTQEDTYREPYGRKMKKWPRQFVLAGTYNPVDGIFTDPTGLRRFWVVGTGVIDLDGLRRDKEQLWAEAVQRYKSGESLQLAPELYAKAEVAAGERRVEDVMTHDVLKAATGCQFIEIREIMSKMGIEVRGKSQHESRAIGKILLQNGFKRVQRKVSGRVTWGWCSPGVVEQAEMSYDTEEEIDIPF
jgi:putative DNA primase/helicase